ncbi:uncharacterized protein LOC127094008 [Lathyrus oleraceus]|uniref:uncharacterized protein LOC127094008 n=1 Tax=Pisum sativum TaxID=3888 RepID=UPI0021D2776D|nr:uncharacterized protein LOC127094008 [Pisum sativum]
MDLVCLPLNQIDVILGMNWLEFNHVDINYFDKLVSFLEFDASDELFVSAKQVDKLMKDDVEVFMILASMKAERRVVIDELPVWCDFPKMFPDDISDSPSKCKVEFSIDLAPGTSLVWMASYRVSTLELSEL